MRRLRRWFHTLIALMPLCAACADPLVHLRTLGTMHTAAAQQCKAVPATCGLLQPCTDGLRAAMATWQSVSAAIAQGDDQLELARVADALMSEGTARTTCLIAMPPKRSK